MQCSNGHKTQDRHQATSFVLFYNGKSSNITIVFKVCALISGILVYEYVFVILLNTELYTNDGFRKCTRFF